MNCPKCDKPATELSPTAIEIMEQFGIDNRLCGGCAFKIMYDKYQEENSEAQ